MIELKGSATNAIVMVDVLDSETKAQILNFIDQDIFKGAKVVIMPDCHKGAGTVIGFTMPLSDFVIPNIVGVDIGCGVDAYKLGKVDVDFKEFDDYIRQNIPYGRRVRSSKVEIKDKDFVSGVSEEIGKIKIDAKRVWHSIGTLGGGNHFIEIDLDEDGNKWLIIHSGSRGFGKSVADHYQNLARKYVKSKSINITKGLEYLPTGSKDGKAYLKAMELSQKYAELNRAAIGEDLLKYFGLKPLDIVKSIHNYIDFKDGIIRKGAISAHKGQRLIIPFNMRDGAIIGRGKGNTKWNNSAPHGAGRLLSRTQAKLKLSLSEFKAQMQGVWTSSVGKRTLDEAPSAYKPMHEVISKIQELVDIEITMRAIYNFKAEE